MRRLIPQSAYARNVLTLMTGTTLAQAIPIAISPLLTRLYSPEEFGRFALYMAVASIASVLVTGRYELAILLPRQDKDALHITALATALSIAISALLFLVVLFFALPIAALLGDAALAPWLYWVPASTLLLGLYQSLNYWSNRKAQYKRLAISRTVQSGSAALAQLGIGYAGSGAVGLVGGANNRAGAGYQRASAPDLARRPRPHPHPAPLAQRGAGQKIHQLSQIFDPRPRLQHRFRSDACAVA